MVVVHAITGASLFWHQNPEGRRNMQLYGVPNPPLMATSGCKNEGRGLFVSRDSLSPSPKPKQKLRWQRKSASAAPVSRDQVDLRRRWRWWRWWHEAAELLLASSRPSHRCETKYFIHRIDIRVRMAFLAGGFGDLFRLSSTSLSISDMVLCSFFSNSVGFGSSVDASAGTRSAVERVVSEEDGVRIGCSVGVREERVDNAAGLGEASETSDGRASPAGVCSEAFISSTTGLVTGDASGLAFLCLALAALSRILLSKACKFPKSNRLRDGNKSDPNPITEFTCSGRESSHWRWWWCHGEASEDTNLAEDFSCSWDDVELSPPVMSVCSPCRRLQPPNSGFAFVWSPALPLGKLLSGSKTLQWSRPWSLVSPLAFLPTSATTN